MLTEWLVEFVGSAFVAIMDNVTGVLPTETGIGSLSGAFGLMMSLDAMFPVSECIAGFLVILAVVGVMFVIKLVQTVISHFPLVGGAGA